MQKNKNQEISHLRVVYCAPDGTVEPVAQLIQHHNRKIYLAPESGLKRLSPLIMRKIPSAGAVSTPHFDLEQEKQFNGLYGVFADSLPDTFGLEVAKQKLKNMEIEVTPLSLLAYIGRWGRGALGYIPEVESGDDGVDLCLPDLYNEAIRVGSGVRLDLDSELINYRMGTVGGTRPKAFITIDSSGGMKTQRGWAAPPIGEVPYLLKFDCTGEFRGRINHETRIEAAYMDMAKAAGIPVVDYKILESGGLYHLAMRRFDRLAEFPYSPVHLHSYWGMVHATKDNDNYEDLLRVALAVTKNGTGEIERAVFRRMVFNVLMVNQDDHHKQHSFLFNGDHWRLAPAYDLTFQKRYLGHSMSVAGSSFPGAKEFQEFAERMGVEKWKEVLDEVLSVARHAGEYLQNHQIPKADEIHEEIQKTADTRMGSTSG